MEHSEGAVPALLHVYHSLLYKVWENTASKWGFDWGGAARGDKKQLDKRRKEGTNTCKQRKCPQGWLSSVEAPPAKPLQVLHHI